MSDSRKGGKEKESGDAYDRFNVSISEKSENEKSESEQENEKSNNPDAYAGGDISLEESSEQEKQALVLPEVGKNKSPVAKEVKKSEFEKVFKEIRVLSSGVSGKAVLCHCMDPDIKKMLGLTDTDIVLLKMPNVREIKPDLNIKEKMNIIHAKKTFELEIKNINDLKKNNHDSNLLRPKLLVQEYDGKPYIIMECIYYNDKNEAKSIEGYLVKMGADARKISSKKLNVARESENLSLVFQGMLNSVEQLHQHGKVHLDLGCRNFVAARNQGVKIIDFGMSLPINDKKTGLSNENPKFLLRPYPLYNRAAIKEHKYGVNTDSFGLKISMMEGMAIYLGFLADGFDMRDKIHCRGTGIRLWKDPIPRVIHGEINLDKLRKISTENNERPILIKHDGKIKIYGNANPDPGSPQKDDWKITELCESSDPMFAKVFGSKMTVMKFPDPGSCGYAEGSYPKDFTPDSVVDRDPHIGKAIQEAKKNQTPVLFAGEGKSWIYRYSATGHDWVFTELSNLKLSEYCDKDQLKTLGNTYKSVEIGGASVQEFEKMLYKDYHNSTLFHLETKKPLPLTEKQSAYIKEKKGHLGHDPVNEIARLDDDKRLDNTFNNLEAYARQSKKAEAKVVLNMLERFKPYLTSYQSNAATLEEDVRLFNKCLASLKDEKKPEKKPEDRRGVSNTYHKYDRNKLDPNKVTKSTKVAPKNPEDKITTPRLK